MSNTENIVILGASYGGLSAAHYLLRQVIPSLPSQKTYKILLVSPSQQVFCRPACPRAMISDGMFEQDKLFVNISTQFQQYESQSFRLVQGKATELNHEECRVTVLKNDGIAEIISFHALVIATGATTASPLLGFHQGSIFLQDCWKSFRQALPSAKRIVIAGGGPAGIETAGELGEYLNGRTGFFVSRKAPRTIDITVVTSGEQILPGLRPSIAARAELYLSRLGVTVIKNVCVQTVNPEGAGRDSQELTAPTIILLDDGRSLEADLFIPATGMTPNTSFVKNKSLLSPDGHIDTNPTTLRVDKAGARTYAIGDASNFARPAVHNILGAVPVLCANMRRDLVHAAGHSGDSCEQDLVFHEDTRETQLVPIGQRKGVGAAMGWQIPSFFVWLIKGRDYWLWTTGDLWNGTKWGKAK